MKNKRGLLYIILMLIILLTLCMFVFINNANSNKLLNYLFFTLVIIFGLYVMTLVVNVRKNKRARFRDKLFNSLVKSSDTVYIMMNEDNHVVYVSNNVEDIEDIKNREYLTKIDKYFSAFYDETNTLLDYLDKNFVIFL